MQSIKDGDRVALTKPLRLMVAGELTGRTLPVGAEGLAGTFRSEVGLRHVQFSLAAGGLCILVEDDSLRKLPELDEKTPFEKGSAISRHLFDVLTEVCSERDHPLPEKVCFFHTMAVELRGFYTPEMLLDIVEVMRRDHREMQGP